MPRSYTKSQALYERACRSLAGGVSSEFRRYSYPHPLFFKQGKGSRITDVDGNEFLDFTLSQGPLILGHSHPRVLQAVEEASNAGQLFAGQHLGELELAERLQAKIPCAELVRFSLSGSESVQAALRLARAATGRPRFLRFEGHYHGWLDSVAFSVTPPADALHGRDLSPPFPWSSGLQPGIEDGCFALPWNDMESVERLLELRHEEIAAVITEPIMCNNGCIPPEPGYLQGLRALCDRYGILLIFDEVITGFRLGPGGAQVYYNVTPDLAIFGKAMASGYPISALVGLEKWMRLIGEGKAIHAGTMNSGNPCIAAANATLETLENENVCDRLFALGRRLMTGLADAGKEAGLAITVQGLGPMFHVGFSNSGKVREYRDILRYDKTANAVFVSAMQEQGIRLIGRGLWYVSGAHVEADVDQALAAAARSFAELRRSSQ